ncbi:type VI secretion system contractile sheath large subunit, partial [Undibacterium seohonense]
VQFDQSTLFKLIYGSEYDTYGGCPYGLLLGGFEIGSSSRDISFLNNIAAISAAAHVPFISAASASLFGLDSFHHLPKPRDLSKIFESPDLIGWRDFCESDNALYVSLVLPHVLLRLPYRKSGFPVEEFEFEELAGDSASEPNFDHFLWGNAAYLLAQRIMSAFSIYHWTAAIHGIEDGGLVENLPLYQYQNMSGMTVQLCPTTV